MDIMRCFAVSFHLTHSELAFQLTRHALSSTRKTTSSSSVSENSNISTMDCPYTKVKHRSPAFRLGKKKNLQNKAKTIYTQISSC
ncbi:hypothetical protein RJT34_13932 [Clitoria ternatea]|uniref:Uncharacterized protein n=1 Tax=Clitoria ternatea TaxID=43366 RepID=A0AAN9PMA2_CLITE